MKLHAIIISVLLTCNALANNTTNLTEEDRQVFIETFAQLAVEEMLNYGIPSSITLAQAILESNWGQGKTAKNANNYFGIKCYNGWEGPTFFAPDDEPGESCFRKYEDVVQSFRDHSEFLKNGSRYQVLFGHPITNYAAWAKGLKSCGYATDPDYAKKLIDIIERYGLFVYDYAMPLDRVEVLDTPVLSVDSPRPEPVLVNTTLARKPAIGSAVLNAPVYKLSHLPAGPHTDAGVAPAAVKPDDEPNIIVVEPVYERIWE